MERKITFIRLISLFALALMITPGSFAQVYQHDFGTTNITAHPYTVAPAIFNADLSASSWSNSTGAGWTSFAGSAGQAIALNNSSGNPAITLTFNVAAGKSLDITSFSFWRQRSNSGAQNWTMTINGINVGSGAVAQGGGVSTGDIAVANPVNGLTGTVTVVMTLSGASGTGTFRIDDFTLNGSVNSNCTAPVISSFAPASGPTNTLVTITGSGFEAGTTSVQFGGVESAGFTVISDTEIKAIVPATAVTGNVTITTNGCIGTSTSFTVLSSSCPSFAAPTELFISEVYDAPTGEGGAIELYNGTSAPIDLSLYTIIRRGSIGGPATITLNLTGILAAGGIHIVRTNTSVCGLTGTPVNLLPTGFNEDDELELVKNTVVIDRVYTPDNVGFTMIRNSNAVVPQAAFNAADWAINNTEDCANLGIHNITSSPSDHITAQPLSAAICEGDNVQYTVTLSAVSTFTYQWKMLNASGNWVNITDGPNFSGATTTQLTVIDAPLELNGAQFYCEATSPGCTLISNAVQLTVSPLPLAVVIPVPPTCTIPTGGILIMPSVGDGLTYSIDGVNFQAGLAFNGLVPGNYTLTIKSSANCVSIVPFVVDPAPLAPAVADVTVTQPDCTTATGSITVNTPIELGLTYSIDGTTFQNDVTFDNLLPGNYTITVMTALGCTSVTAAITINAAPVAPAVATTVVTQPDCTTQGSIEVTAPLGLEYSLDGTTFQGGTTFANLTPGTYTVTTRNADGCTSVTGSITIDPAPGAPATATVTPVQPTCTVTTGSFTIDAPVGNDYTYSIDGTNFQASTTFANLTPGTYTLTTQLNGCTSVTTVTINPVPATPDAATVAVTQPTCTTATGTIEITAPVGAGLSYSIDGTTFQNTTTFANLAPGTYTITTQNTDGCTATATAVVDPAPGAPSVATTAVTQPNCSGVTTGTIEVTAPLGTEYTYSIDGTTFQSGTAFANLAPGTYTVTTDNGGCQSVTGTITINPVPTAPAVADTIVTQPTCATPTGTIVINSPTGAGLTYSIDGSTFQAGTTFTNLPGGAYFVTVMNAGGCTSVTGVINVDDSPIPAVAQANLTQPTCFIGTGRIDVTSPTGSGFTYSIDGTTFQNGTSFINLAPGSYTVTVTNIDGCTSTASFTINAQPATPAAPALSAVAADCGTGTGSVMVTAPLGTQYSYSIDGGTTWQDNTTFDGLTPGSYDVMVRTDAGCESAETTIAVAAPVNDILITGTQGCEGTGFNDTAYILSVSVGGAHQNTATFVWTDSAGNQVGSGLWFDATAYADANGITAAQYPLDFTLTVTTAGGCTKSFTFTVDGTFCGIPRGISPNNDGKNDSFDISGMGANKVSIFNRYGQEIYSRNNYTNEWNGQSNNGDELPTGTYFYIIEHSGKSKTGWVYVNREQ